MPGAAAVAALVDAVAPGHVPPAHVFTGADPHNVRIGRIDGDGADRIRWLIVKDGRPGDARVRGLPHAAGADRNVPGGGVVGVNGDVRDAAAHQRRADFAEREVLGGLCDEGGVGLRGLGGRAVCGAEGEGGRDEGGGSRPGRVVEHGSDCGAVHACGLGFRKKSGDGAVRRAGREMDRAEVGAARRGVGRSVSSRNRTFMATPGVATPRS